MRGLHMGPRWLVPLALLCLLCAGTYALEGLDEEDDSQGVAQQQQQNADFDATAAEGDPLEQERLADMKKKLMQRLAYLKTLPKDATGMLFGPWECGAVAVIAFFIANAFRGAGLNKQYAQAWVEAFASPGSLLEKNFSLLGPGDSDKKEEPLMKEAFHCYKFYASGRRHVQGMLATLNLKPRQDLLSMAWNLVSPTEDHVTFEVLMAPASMPPIVLAVGTPKAARALQQDCTDVANYTKKINATRDSFPHWDNEKLHILAEHSSIFTELFSEHKVQQAFNFAGPNAQALKYFRWLHFTSECTDSSHKQVLKLTFALPAPGSMNDIAPLVALVPLFIDLVGTFKLNPDLKKKAEAHRQKKNDEEEEARRKRQEALSARKMDKAAEEKAKVARMPPLERQKYEEKMQRKMNEKMMRKRAIK
ncbi:hypothetical protein DUNSADRAFT_15669 [Dunaliella salina]|uniref:Uncharacterized protein n=1 Tax=Dunaliella salina TaxID=3046 RepID=A0ABQ7G4Z1_DUNSA|nr:hypothetical protein DUNSADRAFT_15669 [Dunaliella salina]|eukprot:KAF5829670.1 hypothetical protein DUNSADRAFT_15669 [Dunaliella salina]